MRAKILTLRYSATLGGFDDTPLSEFSRDKEIIAVREHFYVVHDTPHITCVLTYQDAIVSPQVQALAATVAAPSPRTESHPRARWTEARRGAPDPCEGMSAAERLLFNDLREWRSKQAHEEGLPNYLILTNRQLVELVRRRPDSATALGNISGLGAGKVQRYGGALLSRLRPTGDAVSQAEPRTEQGPSESAEVTP
jgi:ATP-dependent DNA helicase RecQ